MMNDALRQRFELLKEIDNDGSSYTWAVVGIFREVGTTRLFWGEDAGCSCNDPWDDVRPVDLAPLDQTEFITACARIAKRGHEQAQEALLELRNGGLL